MAQKSSFEKWYEGIFAPGNIGSITQGLKNQYDYIGAPAKASVPVINAKDVVLSGSSLGIGAGMGGSGVTLPNGQTINSAGDDSAGAITDFMNGIFGVSPLRGGEFTDQETGEPVEAGAGGILDTSGFGEWFGRIAIIILGFIFVAVGLSMFKTNVIAAVT